MTLSNIAVVKQHDCGCVASLTESKIHSLPGEQADLKSIVWVGNLPVLWAKIFGNQDMHCINASVSKRTSFEIFSHNLW